MDKPIRSANEAADQIVRWSDEQNISICFDKASKMKSCPIGSSGACCSNCHVGPCRLIGSNAEEEATGVCGASLPSIVARNFLRKVVSGTAAHSDHARDMAFTLLAVATGEAKDFRIADEDKLFKMADILEIKHQDRDVMEVAKDVATTLIDDFGRQRGEINYLKRAPQKTRERWKKWGVVPRGVDREVCEGMHRTHMGVDHEPDNLLMSAVRVALADGWAGSMISTDISDVLFGTPRPMRGKAGFGMFKDDQVNIVVHGHEPTLAEMIVLMADDPEMQEYARSKGAAGINLGGMCCTANEILMRHGIPTAGGFTNQELAILTGKVDAMTVDVQCIMPALVKLSERFHTRMVTTSEKAKFTGATHVGYEEHRAAEVAKEIIKLAVDNFPNRKKNGYAATDQQDLVAGFSQEYIEYMQGGRMRASFRPLNDAIQVGRIRGVVGLAGCDNPRVPAQGLHLYLAKEFIKSDVLVVSTGCGSHACQAAGYMTPEMALVHAGPGLKEVCEAIGISPILPLGSCVDNSRILTILTAMAAEGGLSEEIGGMPGVGIAPEWMSEKALAIGTYFAASGVPVIFGGESPVGASNEVTRIMSETWYERFKGAFHFEPDPEKIFDMALKYIDAARDALKLKKYEPGKFGVERVLMDMAARRESSL